MKYPIQIDNLSNLFYCYKIEKGLLNEWFHDNLPNFCKMTHDWYDNSIELYLGPLSNNILIDDKIIEKCKNCGFSQMWVNYTNNTEEYILLRDKIIRYGLRERPYVKWTEEEAKEYI